MTINKFGTIALTSLMLVGALADGVAAASADEAPNRAYFVANLHYCQPPVVELVDTRAAPTGDAARVYEEVLMGVYGGNCEEFYAKEVLPRLYLSDEQS